MAIHATVKVINEEYLNNHPNTIILQEIVELLQQRTQPTTLYKVRVHTNIEGNEKADELAKEGREKEHTDVINPHEFAHSTPYYYQKDWWHSMVKHRTKAQLDFLKNISLNMIENII